MAMMINQRLKDKDNEDDDLERIDLDALKRMDHKAVNPLKPYEEDNTETKDVEK